MGARVTILVGHHSDVMVKGRLDRLFEKTGSYAALYKFARFWTTLLSTVTNLSLVLW